MTAPQQVEQAAATAAALYAASRAAPDVTGQVAHAISGAAAITESASAAAARIIMGLWQAAAPGDTRHAAGFAAQAGRIIVTAQRSVAAATTASQLLQLRAMGVDANVTVSIPDNVRGAHAALDVAHAAAHTPVDYHPADGPRVRVTVTPAESAPDQLFNRVSVTYNYARSLGQDDAAANVRAEQRIADLVDGNVILAQRLAEQLTLQQVVDLDGRVTGYRRVFHPELSKGGVCGMCVAASDRVYKIGTLKPIHLRCKCTVAAVTDEYDPGHRLNQDDLKMLYTDAGGNAAKHLKRTRYVIEDHSELGPVLARVKGEKVPYYSTTPNVPATAGPVPAAV